MRIGDTIEATWSDGLVITGRYIGTEQGYIILVDAKGRKIVCDSSHVIFKILSKG